MHKCRDCQYFDTSEEPDWQGGDLGDCIHNPDSYYNVNAESYCNNFKSRAISNPKAFTAEHMQLFYHTFDLNLKLLKEKKNEQTTGFSGREETGRVCYTTTDCETCGFTCEKKEESKE